MSIYWMVSIFLGCMFCQASQNICNFNDQLETICAAPRDTVHIPCPDLHNTDLVVDLIKNEKGISRCIFNSTTKTLNCVHELSSDIIVPENQTGFNLTVTNASSHGLYRCDSRTIFPPPISKNTGPSKILVLVQGHQCLSSMAEVHIRTYMDLGPVWIGVLVFLCAYSLIVSIITVVNWVKLKRMDSYSDYMNTKPRPSKDRKKRRGIQTPTPLYFWWNKCVSFDSLHSDCCSSRPWYRYSPLSSYELNSSPSVINKPYSASSQKTFKYAEITS